VKSVESLLNDLVVALEKSRVKPYLPIWGEIFGIIKDFKYIAKISRTNLVFYEIQPMGRLKYDYKKNYFIVEIPDVNIIIKDNELVDSLVNGRFRPKNEKIEDII